MAILTGSSPMSGLSSLVSQMVLTCAITLRGSAIPNSSPTVIRASPESYGSDDQWCRCYQYRRLAHHRPYARASSDHAPELRCSWLRLPTAHGPGDGQDASAPRPNNQPDADNCP